jgi:hypothetical protein
MWVSTWTHVSVGLILFFNKHSGQLGSPLQPIDLLLEFACLNTSELL